MTDRYATALRVQRRALDGMRAGIGSASETVTRIEDQQHELRAQLSEERRALADWSVCADAYFRRVRGELEQLADRRRIATATLDRMRDEARDAFGSLRALEVAADRCRATQQRRIDGIEQREQDDRSAALLIRRPGASPRP